LLCAALSPGHSRLTGALFAEDTAAMLAVVSALGADVTADEARGTVDVVGADVRHRSTARRRARAPLCVTGLRVRLSSPAVSVPYLRLTAAVMAHFGVRADLDDSGALVNAGPYRACDFAVEPDASAASYFLGAAAITGGRVTIEGLGSSSLQGDVAFADVLERMGARVDRAADAITVTGPSTSAGLHGVDVDMADISDTAQTVAAVAVFASTPTRVRGIGFIRANPGCVAKTYPGYFADLARLG
jgi:3-phosphoshikimate 1-carboxyvinyltransferase